MSTQTSRRAVLAGAAAMPALALPALANDDTAMSADEIRRRYREADPQVKAIMRVLVRDDDAANAQPDPVFAAIERFKAYDAVATETSKQEPKPRSPEYPAWKVKRHTEMEKWNALRDAMFQTVPTTQAGAFALVAVATGGEYAAEGDVETEDALMLLDTLAKAVRS
jgi:hypothetical protein